MGCDAKVNALIKVKKAMRLTEDEFDDQIAGLMSACLQDLGIAGVEPVLTEPIILRAVTTYCQMNFGAPDEYDRLKKSYDEQKAQLSMASGYTKWTDQA